MLACKAVPSAVTSSSGTSVAGASDNSCCSPFVRVATMGSPARIASSTASGRASSREGETNRSMSSSTASTSSRKPRKWMPG